MSKRESGSMKSQTPAPKAGKAVASKPAATPLPWKLDSDVANSDNLGIGVIADTEEGEGVAECYLDADASLIVKAVNSHAALVQALKDLAGATQLHKLNVRKSEDFSLMVAHAQATKLLHELAGQED